MRGRPGRIVVVTDLQESGWDVGDRVAVPEAVTVIVADVGAPPPNLAVASARLSADRVVATIRNAGPEPRGAGAAERARRCGHVSVDARGGGGHRAGWRRQHSRRPPSRCQRCRWASVSVDDAAGAAADNARYLVLDRASKPTVLVIATAGDLRATRSIWSRR